MSNLFVDLPLPAGNGVGAAVDVSLFGTVKTIVVGGDLLQAAPTAEILVEIATAVVPTVDDFAPALKFDKSKNFENFEGTAQQMRARLQGFTEPLPPNLKVSVGAFESIGLIADAGLLVFGHTNVAAAADTRFLAVGSSDSTAPTVSEFGFNAPRSGTLRNFFIRHNAAAGNGSPVTYDLIIGGFVQGLGLSLATGLAGSASDLATTIAVSQGQLIEAIAVKAVGIGSGAVDAQFSMEFA